MEVIAPIAYGGKKDCTNPMCRRMVKEKEGGGWEFGECLGWHCSYCDEPTSYQGHNCDIARTLIDEAERIYKERQDGV